MKITIDIGGKDYIFEMNRATYKRLLGDKEYAAMQNEITKRVKAKGLKNKTPDGLKKEIEDELIEDDISAVILRNMVMEEQVFYYALLQNQPEITNEQAVKLMDEAIYEYGSDEVSKLVATLIENFTRREEEPKKQMVMRMS
jgi:signal recognition particle GTPase